MPDFDIPRSRIEALLQNILGAENALPDPISRNEKILHAILGEIITLDDPKSRNEKLLQIWNGATGINADDPKSNNERILHNIIGNAVDINAPKSRIEILLYKIMQQYAGLPEGYTEVAGIQFNAQTYYRINDFYLRGSDTFKISLSVEKACNVFGCYTTADAQDNFSLYISTAATAKYLRHGTGVYNSAITNANLGKRYDITITPTGTSGMPTDSVITEEEFTASADLCIGHTSPSGSSSKLDGNIYGPIEVKGRLKLIPCKRNNDNALGYYDTYGKTFYAPIGTAPTPIN